MSDLFHIELALAREASARVATRAPAVMRMARPGPPAARPAFAMPPDYQAFSIGPLGNFPYYWQDPRTLDFNATTYGWIASGARSATGAVRLDGLFPNRFLNVASKLVYSLSTKDQAALVAAQQKATNEQRALLQAWRTAFGSIPAGDAQNPPINLIIEQITTRWASPPTSLDALIAAIDPRALLNQAPAAAAPIVPVLLAYIGVLSTTAPLLNNVTRNNGLLKAALDAVRTPGFDNGALQTTSGRQPGFEMKTPLDDILAGLSATASGKTVRLDLEARAKPNGKLDVGPSGAPPSVIAPADLLALRDSKGDEALTPALAALSGRNTLSATFPGVTTVSFGPATFSQTQMRDWFWIDPLVEAIRNGTRDVSGFKFGAMPATDFSENGGFGFVTSVIISRNPSIRIATGKQDAAHLASVLSTNPNADLSFLGRTIGRIGSAYALSSEDEGAGTALTLAPMAAEDPNGRAFVLGVMAEYPCADA